MPIRIRKPPRRLPVRKAKKSKAAQEALDRLNAFLNAAEPEPVYWLTRVWDDQQQAITYKELREAILSGHLDEKTLAAWQQDYANFVNDKLKPIWTEAMEAGAAKVMAEHPDFYFNPMEEGIRNWTATHGAEWVTNITDEQREAITSMIDQATTGAWTNDELARAIRPTIGLTKPQAIANLNYYQRVKTHLLEKNPNMKEETATKKAQEAAAKYAGRQHRSRAYTIATTELAYAYNKGADDGVKQAIEQGYMGKTQRVWSTAYDDGVCEICAALEGTTIDMDGEFKFKGNAGHKQTPPAHPRCRCGVEYREIEPPKIKPEPQEDAAPKWAPDEQAAPPQPPEPEQPTIPKDLAVPDGMTHQGKPNLGGTGEMHAYTDAGGNQWLFKPAQSKSGNPETFRAYVQEAGYKVQHIIDPDSAVPVGTGELGGKFGAFQKRITNVDTGIDFKAWQSAGGPLPEGAAAQFQREHVTDWLLGNFDSHGGNFIMDDAGRLIGIDKEQAFKYITKDGAQKMSYSFHPNAGYGEKEPIYNTIYRRFAKGEIDLDLQDTLAYIKRVEAIPDAEYREIFRSYAEALHGKGKAAEELLDAIVERKSTIRETYRVFYSDLLTERTGKKQIFTWADEAAQHAKQPLAAVTHSADTLKKMNVAELKQLAKQKGIPYYNKFSKTELVAAISDPVKAVEISAQTKAKLLELEATRGQRLGRIPQAAPTTAKGALKAADVFQDMSVVPARKFGVPVASDKGMVEGLNLTARRMTIDGSEVYEITGKLSEATWSETWNRLKGQSEVRELIFEKSDDTLAIFSKRPIDMQGVTVKARCLEDGGSTFELYVHNGSSEYSAWRGFFRVRVPVSSSGAADAQMAKSLLERVGLSDVTTTPTKEAEDLFKKARLLWQNAPRRVSELNGLQGREFSDMLDVLLKQEGIDPKRIGRMTMREVFDGYQTLVEDGIGKEYEKAGLRYVWSGLREADDVVRVIQSKGFVSTNNRCKAGLDFTGASPKHDMESGGSDSVFTRIGVKMKDGSRPRFDDCFKGSTYRILIDLKEMQRTDWYAYTSDSFGTTAEGDMLYRPSPVDFIQKMATSYRVGNEIMFRQGIARESFIGISCQTEALKARLLEKFKEAGITAINGIPVKDFVKVGKEI